MKLASIQQKSLLAVCVFLYVLVTCMYFYQGANVNVNSRFALARTLAEEGSVWIDTYASATVDKSFLNGHYLSDKAPGISILSAAVLFCANPIIDAITEDKHIRANARLYLLQFVFLALFSAWCMVLFFRWISELLGEKKRMLAFALATLGFSSILAFPYATLFFSHQISGNILFMAAYYVFHPDKLRSWTSRLGVLFLIGWGATIEYPPVPILGCFYGVLLWRFWKSRQTTQLRWFPVFLIPGIINISMFAVYNLVAFGSPFAIGYQHLHLAGFQQGMSEGLMGVNWPSFGTMMALLFSTFRGLFYTDPVLLCALPAVWFGARKKELRPLCFVCTAVFLYFWLLNSGYHFWAGGGCLGPRHMVASVLFLWLAVGFLPSRCLEFPGFWVLAFSSAIYMLAATSVTLILGENIDNPLWDYVLPLFATGNMSISAFPMFSEDVPRFSDTSAFYFASFNLGELLFGLTGRQSLLPLCLWQMFVFCCGLVTNGALTSFKKVLTDGGGHSEKTQ